jgi:hypothetical protein
MKSVEMNGAKFFLYWRAITMGRILQPQMPLCCKCKGKISEYGKQGSGPIGRNDV